MAPVVLLGALVSSSPRERKRLLAFVCGRGGADKLVKDKFLFSSFLYENVRMALPSEPLLPKRKRP